MVGRAEPAQTSARLCNSAGVCHHSEKSSSCNLAAPSLPAPSFMPPPPPAAGFRGAAAMPLPPPAARAVAPSGRLGPPAVAAAGLLGAAAAAAGAAFRSSHASSPSPHPSLLLAAVTAAGRGAAAAAVLLPAASLLPLPLLLLTPSFDSRCLASRSAARAASRAGRQFNSHRVWGQALPVHTRFLLGSTTTLCLNTNTSTYNRPASARHTIPPTCSQVIFHILQRVVVCPPIVAIHCRRRCCCRRAAHAARC